MEVLDTSGGKDLATASASDTDGLLPAALTLTVAFAGHRALEDAKLRPVLAKVFAQIAEAMSKAGSSPTASADGETVLSAHVAVLPTAQPVARPSLMLGYAAGADRIAAAAWSDIGLGPIHFVFPFADTGGSETVGWTDDPDVASPDCRVDTDPAGIRRFTILDGANSARTYPFRHPHLEQTRWLVRWSEIVVVAWNGEPPAGPGGTADLLALAVRANQPVVWIDTREGKGFAVNLIRPERLWRDTSFEELSEALQAADGGERDEISALRPMDTDTLAAMLALRSAPPGRAKAASATPSHSHEPDHGTHETPDLETDSRRRYIDGLPRFAKPTRIIGGFVSWAWTSFFKSLFNPAEANNEAKEPRESAPLIKQKLLEADAAANYLGALHRSAQVALLVIATLAVLFGTLPALIPDLKWLMVTLELLLVVTAQLFYRSLFAHNTHYRWGDARRLAERLRSLDATWPLGFDVGDERTEAPSTWTEWYSRIVRRTIGAPQGYLSEARRRQLAARARTYAFGIVDGQAAYHHTTFTRMEKLHDRLRWLEGAGFIILITLLTFYLAWFGLYSLHNLHWPLLDWVSKPRTDFSNALLIFSAVLPAIAAACMGIEAKLGVLEAQQKSGSLQIRFAEISAALKDEPSVHRQEALLREAAALLIADVDRWRDAAALRSMSGG